MPGWGIRLALGAGPARLSRSPRRGGGDTMDGRAQGVSPRLAYAGDAGNGLAADRTSVRSSRGEIIGAAAHTTRDQCFAARVDRAPNPEQRPPEFDSGRPW